MVERIVLPEQRRRVHQRLRRGSVAKPGYGDGSPFSRKMDRYEIRHDALHPVDSLGRLCEVLVQHGYG